MRGTGQPSFDQKTVQALAPASRNANTYDSDPIDMLGYEWAEILVDAGAVAGASTLAVTGRDGSAADGSDDALVTADDGVTTAAFGAIASDNDNQVHAAELYVPPRKRYLTVRAVVANSAAVFGVLVKLHKGRKSPVESPTPAFTIID